MKQKSDFKGLVRAFEGSSAAVPEAKPRYCLYSRKSTESEERQVLFFDSQIKEMFRLAEREGLDVAEIRREAHSAKATGQRKVFNGLGLRHKLDEEIERLNKFQGHVLQTVSKAHLKAADVDVRTYAKYVLREGSASEKRELLGNLRSRLVYENKAVSLVP